MRLTELLKGTGIALPIAPETGRFEITGLAADSRKVEPGFLFAALPGARADGRDFVGEAIRRGAAAVLAPATAETAVRSVLARAATDAATDTAMNAAAGVAVIVDGNPRRLLALMAARFFARQPETIARRHRHQRQDLRRQLPPPDLGARRPQRRQPRHARPRRPRRAGGTGTLTTPDPVALHRTLADLADAASSTLAMEASSHGLDQFRLDGVRVAAAAFTNLSRDHLDYHGTIEAYLAAKLRLFVDAGRRRRQRGRRRRRSGLRRVCARRRPRARPERADLRPAGRTTCG